ncbi:MAG: M42 family metallopeptidase [Methanothrix sp.]|jgi:Cellulase M and related proteins|uniref:Peptidase M42 family protein n=1 Tax=Methanothrix thermoacetophila (strain DSM 6194 / JCM 14653 / NBRC 101360 / PT) TaxID=349307 RepID=A0B7P8_METTP|nr:MULTISPECIES: M42 family metallopeptidase [Methanothrix]ABK14722.1 peptidase M42 family protein [Methanothrix thermoacetophila PT]MBC7079006.1 M42 family metallopeptidase [Methanothrix sp.]NPU87162.1 M42 family metallopeptidase [Methanothrix sp.]
MRSLLERLSNAHGISGREGSVMQIIRDELAPHVDDVQIDTLGNLVATRRGKSPSVMIAAHADEIGLMVKFVDEKGFVYFVKIGGWFDQTLLNQRVILHTKNGPVFGVIGSKPPHVMKEEDRKKPVDSRDMFIDVGARDQNEAREMGIVPGVPITIDRSFVPLRGDRVTGKAFDNRAGVAMMIEAMKRTRTECTVYAVSTVMEEVGLKGAKTCAFGIRPDLAIVTDTTIPGDHPGIEKKDSALEMGKGPVITVVDASGRGLIADEDVLDWLQKTAEQFSIPVQLDVSGGGTTDATAIQLSREGVKTGVVSIATRYIHSPVEVLSLEDLDKGAELIARALETAPRYFRREG